MYRNKSIFNICLVTFLYKILIFFYQNPLKFLRNTDQDIMSLICPLLKYFKIFAKLIGRKNSQNRDIPNNCTVSSLSGGNGFCQIQNKKCINEPILSHVKQPIFNPNRIKLTKQMWSDFLLNIRTGFLPIQSFFSCLFSLTSSFGFGFYRRVGHIFCDHL